MAAQTGTAGVDGWSAVRTGAAGTSGGCAMGRRTVTYRDSGQLAARSLEITLA